MKSLIKALIIPLCLLGACKDDLFERDLSEETIDIIIPSANHQSTIEQVHFKWEELEGVSEYRILLVHPDFNNIQSYLLDTLVSGTDFYYTLAPGSYQWKIRGENNSSNTSYQGPFNIQIDSTQDVTGQTITLTSPSNSSFLNQANPTFNWLSLSAADGYDIVVKTTHNFTTGTIAESSSTSSTSYVQSSSLVEGEYSWGVRGTNSTTSTTTSYSSRSFTIDLTVPSAPSLISPNAASFAANQQITFSWNRQPDIGAYPSPLADSVFIYTDAALTNVYQRFSSSSASHLDSIAVSGTYYWRVKTFDEAGNISGFSSSFSFDIL